jgi:hypothetical protein
MRLNRHNLVRYCFFQMYIHTDEILFDPLAQSDRDVNMLLLRGIEDAIYLADGGGWLGRCKRLWGTI